MAGSSRGDRFGKPVGSQPCCHITRCGCKLRGIMHAEGNLCHTKMSTVIFPVGQGVSKSVALHNTTPAAVVHLFRAVIELGRRRQLIVQELIKLIKQMVGGSNIPISTLQDSPDSGERLNAAHAQQNGSSEGPDNTGFANLLGVWPPLPKPIKAGILAMVNAAMMTPECSQHRQQRRLTVER